MTIFKSKYPDIVVPNLTIPQFLFENWNNVQQDKPAFIDGFSGEKITFGEFKLLVQKMAKGLHAKGIRKGDVVALIAPNSIHYPVIIHGILLTGGVATTANPLSSSEDLGKQLADSKAKIVFTSSDAELSEKVKIAATLAKQGAKTIEIGSSDYAALLNNDGVAPDVKILPTDLAILPYSSGTTGLPKGVMLQHKSVMVNILQSNTIDAASVDSKAVAADILPMFHIYGIVCYLVQGLYLRIPVIVYSKFDFQALLEGIQKYKITHLNIVPPVALAFAKHPLVDKYDLSSIRILNSGAAPLGSDVQLEVFKRTKVAIRQGYGMSELPTGVIFCPYTPGVIRKAGSSGVLLPNIEAKVISPETGKELGVNERGEICFRCPNMMLGYLNRPEENIIDKDGFLHTGDIGYVDEDGDWFVVDRLKELIKYKGFQVAPAELEALILTHPKVLDVAVIGKPDPHAGELPTAFVVLKPNQTMPESELVEWTNANTSTYKHLRGGVIYTDIVPKSPAGKILRRLLRDRFVVQKAKL